MTTKELREELITFKDDEYCSFDCTFFKLKSFGLSKTHFICMLKGEKNIELTRVENTTKINRCQTCKDLF